MIQFAQTSRYLAISLMILFSAQVYGQKSFVATRDQQFKVEGTSTLHDWEMVSNQAEGKASITVQNSKIVTIGSLVVTMPATSIKSGKKAMDDIAYEALHAKQHPKIYFDLNEVESITGHLVRATGKFTIAGTSCTISFEANYKVSGDSIQFTGSLPITFTQFKIDPPKAMFGTIKTGDDLKISFESTFRVTN